MFPRHARQLDLDHPGGGQVESGVAQALGTALYEHLIVDDAGTVTTPVLRHYHIPQMADVRDPWPATPSARLRRRSTFRTSGPYCSRNRSSSALWLRRGRCVRCG